MSHGRSFTDPITGHVSLRRFRLEDQIERLLAGTLPLNDLPEILHERVHYEIATTPVGVALAVLGLRVAQSRLRGDESVALKQDSARLFLARTYLRPLAEGLAHFAEHDAFPGSSSVMSDVMALVFPLFCVGTLTRGPGREEFERRRKAALVQTRSASFAISAKADLLESPLDDPSGYLVGYWLIKQLHHESLHHSDRMYDSEFFLAHALTWFFCDAELAEALISPPEARGGALLQTVSVLLQLRLAEFLGEAFAMRVADNETHMASATLPRSAEGYVSPTTTSASFPGFCGWTPERMEAFSRALDEVRVNLGGILIQLWNNRSIFRLGHFDADICVEHRRFQAAIGEHVVLSGEALDVLPGSGGGRVEAFLGWKGLSSVIVVRRGDELVAAVDVYSKSVNKARELAMARRAPPSGHSEVLQMGFGRLAEPVPDVPVWLIDQAKQMAQLAFLMPALRQTDPPRTLAIVESLKGGGILRALRGDRDLLRTLAVVSLQNSFGQFSVERLAENLQVSSFELREQFERINQLALETLDITLIGGLPELALSFI